MTMAGRFETRIQLEGKTATFFVFPLDVRAVFSRARPPVRVTIGGIELFLEVLNVGRYARHDRSRDSPPNAAATPIAGQVVRQSGTRQHYPE